MTVLQYELLAEALRYVFAVLVLFILWRSAANAFLEYRREKKLTRDVGAAGVIRGYAALTDEWQDEDAWRPLYDDTVLGKALDCNFRIKGHGLRDRHARVYFEKGHAYIERLCSDKETLDVDGKPVPDCRELFTGSRIRAGEATLIITLERDREVPEDGE